MKKLTAFQILAIGQFSLFGGILMLYLGNDVAILAILAGILFGFSIVMNVMFLKSVRQKYRNDMEKFKKYKR